MATFDGEDGVVRLGGSNVIAEVRSFSVEETADTKEDTAMGDSARTYKRGRTTWTGEVSCWFDDTDTNGQQALTIGGTVSLEFLPEGSGSGAYRLTGTAIVTQIGSSQDQDGLVEATFQFQGSGPLVRDALS